MLHLQQKPQLLLTAGEAEETQAFLCDDLPHPQVAQFMSSHNMQDMVPSNVSSLRHVLRHDLLKG